MDLRRRQAPQAAVVACLLWRVAGAPGDPILGLGVAIVVPADEFESSDVEVAGRGCLSTPPAVWSSPVLLVLLMLLLLLTGVLLLLRLAADGAALGFIGLAARCSKHTGRGERKGRTRGVNERQNGWRSRKGASGIDGEDNGKKNDR